MDPSIKADRLEKLGIKPAASVSSTVLLGQFVTAKLKGQNNPRQGWVVEIDPLIIQGRSGEKYECEGEPVIVTNPPTKTP